MASVGLISIGLQVSTAQLKKGLADAKQNLSGFSGAVQTMGKGVGGSIASVVKGFGWLGLAVQGVQTVISGLTSMVSVPLSLAASAEQTAVSFEVLTGSAEKGKKVMDDLRKFAASTPFEFPELADAAKKLVAFGFNSDTVVTSMRRLGDISAGLGIPIGELADLFGKAKVQGRMTMEDINQLAGRGIPIQEELAKQFGVSGEEVRKLVETGQVSFGNLEEAIKSLTGEGGRFAGLMAKQSQTLGGLWSTMKDNATTALTTIGLKLADSLNIREVMGNLLSNLDAMMPQIEQWIDTAVGYIAEGFKWAGQAILVVADVVDVLHDGFLFLRAGVTKAIANIVQGWSYVGKAIETVVNLLPGVEVQFADTLQFIADDLNKLAGEQWKDAKENFMKAPPSEGIQKFFDTIGKAATQSAKDVTQAAQETEAATKIFSNGPAQDLIKKYQEEIDKFGLESRDAQIAKLPKDRIDPALIERAKQLNRELTNLETAKELQSPLVEVQKDIARYVQALKDGAITQEQFSRAVGETKSSLGIVVDASGIDAYKQKLSELWQAYRQGIISKEEFDRTMAQQKEKALGIKVNLQVDASGLESPQVDTTALQDYKQRLQELQQALRQGIISKQDFDRAMNQAKEKSLGIKVDPEGFQAYKDRMQELQSAYKQGMISAGEFRKAAQDALPDKVKTIIDDSKTPLQKFKEELAQLQQYRGMNLINEEQYQSALAKLKGELEGEFKLSAKAEYGSAEARDTILRHRLGTGSNDPMRDVAQTSRLSLAEQQKQTRALERLASSPDEYAVVSI